MELVLLLTGLFNKIIKSPFFDAVLPADKGYAVEWCDPALCGAGCKHVEKRYAAGYIKNQVQNLCAFPAPQIIN
jgi:hypothetical protein